MEPISLGLSALTALKRYWYVAPILAMAGYATVLHHRVEVRDESLRLAGVTQTQLEDRNRLVQASLDAATRRIADNNARIAEGERLLADQRVRSAAELAAFQERYTATAATVKALEASAARPPADGCVVSDLAKTALENL